uniref:CinA family protein n=1 Tax=Agathobacter sp. TaxID=2021311 RepID=UPI004055CD92
MDFEAVKQGLFCQLSEKNAKLAVAESCTGGMVASYVCDIAGISAYFEEGYVVYSVDAKVKNLGIARELIETYGVVSTQTAEAMAVGAAEAANADCAVATTGVAGPAGGTEETPVGCVCFGCVVGGNVYSEQHIFRGSRAEIRIQAAQYALEFLYYKLKAFEL